MKVLTPEQVHRVYDVTDSLFLHRNWVVIPLAAAERPLELVMPDGKVLIRPPGGARFESWLEGLRLRLQDLDLSRTPKRGEHDPIPQQVPADAPPGSGPRRLYVHWRKPEER